MTQEYKPSLKSWFNPSPEEMAANRRLFLSFTGRVDRQAYWSFAVAPGLIFLTLAVLFDLPTRMTGFGFMVTLLIIAWVAIAIGVKRCHDRGRPGWFLLAHLIPAVGPIWVLVELGFLPTKEEGNSYISECPEPAERA
jgi:uncharacterized membrane protein YhaH (DUF805 family)